MLTLSYIVCISLSLSLLLILLIGCISVYLSLLLIVSYGSQKSKVYLFGKYISQSNVGKGLGANLGYRKQPNLRHNPLCSNQVGLGQAALFIVGYLKLSRSLHLELVYEIKVLQYFMILLVGQGRRILVGQGCGNNSGLGREKLRKLV